MIKKLVNKTICLFFRHKIVNEICEDDLGIYTRRCVRCGCSIGFPAFWWNLYNHPPPLKKGQCQEMAVKSWHKYCDERVEWIRNNAN